MSYQETRTGASIFSGILVLAAYCLYAFNPARMAALPPGDLKPWAATMLIFIAIGIGAAVVIQVVFHIFYSVGLAVRSSVENAARGGEVDEKGIEKDIEKAIHREMVEDERDRQIELKSMRIGFIVAGVGFVSALLALVFNYSPVVALNIVYLSFLGGSLLEGAGQLFYYQRGG